MKKNKKTGSVGSVEIEPEKTTTIKRKALRTVVPVFWYAEKRLPNIKQKAVNIKSMMTVLFDFTKSGLGWGSESKKNKISFEEWLNIYSINNKETLELFIKTAKKDHNRMFYLFFFVLICGVLGVIGSANPFKFISALVLFVACLVYIFLRWAESGRLLKTATERKVCNLREFLKSSF